MIRQERWATSGSSGRGFGSQAGRIRPDGPWEGSRGTVSCGAGELSGYFMKVTPLDTIPGFQAGLTVIKFQS